MYGFNIQSELSLQFIIWWWIDKAVVGWSNDDDDVIFNDDDAFVGCSFAHHLNFPPLNMKFTSWELFWNIIMADPGEEAHTYFLQLHHKIIIRKNL